MRPKEIKWLIQGHTVTYVSFPIGLVSMTEVFQLYHVDTSEKKWYNLYKNKHIGF